MKPKKYKLLRDLPDSKPGDIYIWNDSQKAYYKDGNVCGSYWSSDHVEDNPDWFEEVKETERAEIMLVSHNIGATDGTFSYSVYSNKKIDCAITFGKVKKAIEQVLNGEYDPDAVVLPTTTDASSFSFKDGELTVSEDDAERLRPLTKEPQPKTYTQSEYDKAIKEAFKAARKKAADPRTDIEKYYDDLSGNGDFNEYEYSNFKDYQATLKK